VRDRERINQIVNILKKECTYLPVFLHETWMGSGQYRPHKKQKGGGKRQEVRRLQGAFETRKSLDIRTPSSASQSSCLPSAAAKVSKKPLNRKSNTSLIHDDNKQLTRSCQARVTQMSEAVSGFDAEWKKLHVETYEEQEPRLYVEVKNVVVPESLVGVVPGVAVAAFAGDNAVGIKTNPLNKLPQNKTNQKRKKKLLFQEDFMHASSSDGNLFLFFAFRWWSWHHLGLLKYC
jgi:hypothetical protein